MLKHKANTRDTVNGDITVWSLLRARIGLLILSLLLVGVNRVAGLTLPYLSKYLIDDVIVGHSRFMLAVLLVVGAAATLVQGFSTYLINYTATLSAHRLVADLRNRVHNHGLRLSVTYYDENQTGTLVSRVMTDVEGVRTLFGSGLISFLGATATAIIAFAILMSIHPVMTLAVFSVLAAFAIFLRSALRKYRSVFKEINVIKADLTARLTESLGGIRVIKAYHAESHEHEVFAKGSDHLLQRTVMCVKATALLDLIVVLVTGAVGAVVMYFGGVAAMSGTMTLGDLFRYVMFMGVLVTPLIQAVSIGTQFNEAFAGLERVRELLAELREDQDASRSVRVRELRGEICFESVSFAYGNDLPVLKDVSFRAEPGMVTALVGPSGAGKTTIVALIAGFHNTSKGTVWVDDLDVSRLDLESYRKQLGMVPQDSVLFSGTIRDNVRFSRPDATDEEIIRACRLAHVEEFACRLEDSYDTVVGERGIKLSAGQRQRIAIARAILADPRILILDEPTSSLDSVSEAVVQQAFSNLLRDRTTFIIAHRLSTIRRADQILVIKDGRLVECGTHESLLRTDGEYWQLYKTQNELQSNLFLAPGEGDHSLSRQA